MYFLNHSFDRSAQFYPLRLCYNWTPLYSIIRLHAALIKCQKYREHRTVWATTLFGYLFKTGIAKLYRTKCIKTKYQNPYGSRYAKPCLRAYADSESSEQTAHNKGFRCQNHSILKMHQWRENARISRMMWIRTFCACSKALFRLAWSIWNYTNAVYMYNMIFLHRDKAKQCLLLSYFKSFISLVYLSKWGSSANSWKEV